MSKQSKAIDARSLPGHLQARLRRKAVELVDSGLTQAQAAEAVGVSRTTVTKWIGMRNEGGDAALAPRRRGRRPGTGALRGWQCAKVVNLITDRHPEQLKLPFVLWTARAVGQLIEREFGARLADRTVRAYLADWGFTPQRPARKAAGRDDEAVRRWTQEEYPQVRGEARRAGAMLMWLDETGLRSEEVAGRSYAPRGRTPSVVVSGARLRLNVITAISAGGALAFSCFGGRFNARVFVAFLGRLIRHAKGRPVHLVCDNHSVHTCRTVTRWVAARADQIKLVFLPKYAPEINPVELLNNDMKTNTIRTLCPATNDEMHAMAHGFLRTAQRRPRQVQSYFQGQHVRYTIES